MATTGEISEVKNEITFDWRIKDFFSLSEEMYRSERFYFGGASWEIWIYPNGEAETKSTGYLDLYLMRVSSGSPIKIYYLLGLKRSDGELEREKLFGRDFVNSGCGEGCIKFISRSELIKMRDELAPSGVLNISCTMKNDVSKLVAGSLFNRLQDLSDKLKELYEKSEMTDVKLDFIQSNIMRQQIRVHRLILQARSTSFAAILSNSTNKNASSASFITTDEVVLIDDVDIQAMNILLGYIYSGDLQNLKPTNVFSVYAAAKKYNVKDAKNICLDFIINNLSEDWVCDVINFAEMHQEEDIGHYAREYLKENIQDILPTKQWEKFAKENQKLSNEVLAFTVNECCQNEMLTE